MHQLSGTHFQNTRIYPNKRLRSFIWTDKKKIKIRYWSFWSQRFAPSFIHHQNDGTDIKYLWQQVNTQYVPVVTTRGEMTGLIFSIRGESWFLEFGEILDLEWVRRGRAFSPALQSCWRHVWTHYFTQERPLYRSKKLYLWFKIFGRLLTSIWLYIYLFWEREREYWKRFSSLNGQRGLSEITFKGRRKQSHNNGSNVLRKWKAMTPCMRMTRYSCWINLSFLFV